MEEVVRCKYCGKVLKSVTSQNMKCGPECLRKHYKPRTLLDAIAESKQKSKDKEKRCMNRKEVIALIESYGYELVSFSNEGETQGTLHFRDSNLMENINNHRVTINVDIRFDVDRNLQEFQFKYITLRGALTLSTGECSPFTNEKHFRSHEKVFREFAQQLYMYEEASRQ